MGIGHCALTAAQIVTQTASDLTYYVRTTGNDNNDGLSADTALLTVQAAIDKIPKLIKHIVIIDIGEGNFAGFYVTAFTLDKAATLTVKGVLGAPTLTSGTTSGTATGGSTVQLIDSGQSWTVNELRGRLVLVDGNYRAVRNNDATTINFAHAFGSTCSGKAYSILEQKTVFNTNCALTTYRVCVRANVHTRDNLILRDLKLYGVTSGGGLLAIHTAGIYLQRVLATNFSSAGIALQKCSSECNFADCVTMSNNSWGLNTIASRLRNLDRHYSYSDKWPVVVQFGSNCSSGSLVVDSQTDSTGAGLQVANCTIVTLTSLTCEGCAGAGLYAYYSLTIDIPSFTSKTNKAGAWVWSVLHMDFGSVDVQDNTEDGFRVGGFSFIDIDSGTVAGNGGYGFYFNQDSGSTYNRIAHGTLNLMGNITVSSNTLGGILCTNHGVVCVTNVDGSNTGYGLTLRTGASAVVTTDTGITGSSGDVTIDDGYTALTWASDFSADGDQVYNATNGCRIERRDS